MTEAKKRKSDKGKSVERKRAGSGEDTPDITSTKDLKVFLLKVRDSLVEGQAAVIHAASAMNHVLNVPNIYEYLDKETKEIARDVWLRIKQSGMNLRNPSLLFDPGEEVFHTNQ